ncbi:hypothetical protein ScPMuIL_008072 [Solemya velum]
MATTKPSPWGRTPTVVPCSLEEVMSEQLADDLREKEIGERSPGTSLGDKLTGQGESLMEALENSAEFHESGDTSDDFLLAQMMQLEYDKEHDEMLRREELKYNGTNKVSISFENYKTVHPVNDEPDSDEEYDDDFVVKSEWDRTPPAMGKSGISGRGKNITTKHDAVICGRRNASRMMDFPPEFESGDGEGMDMQLPNHVYNKLKCHSVSENKRSQKLHEKKEHSTAEGAVDAKTRMMLYKFVNREVLSSVSGSISAGKESVVFHAVGGRIRDEPLPPDVAIKIFKTTLNEFRGREKYYHGDHRFWKDDYKKQNPRRILKIWAEKEMANLNRMKKFHIPCPRVLLQKKHILIMTFIGRDGKPAPKLKEAHLSAMTLGEAFRQTVRIMKTMYRDCGLVHADLSEYNMLWFEDQIWIIDVSQSVEFTHPLALNFLYRDCKNICTYFSKNCVPHVPQPEELFNDITDLKIGGEGADFNARVQRYQSEKKAERLATETSFKDYAFDFFFEKSQKERSEALGTLGFSDSEEEEENSPSVQD